MLNTEQILDGLLEKRANVESERSNIEAEFERIAQKKADLEQRLSALDIVIKEFNGNALAITEVKNPSAELNSELETEKVETNEHKARRKYKNRKGLKHIAREHFTELPTEFTKHDVAKIILRERKELKGNINENTLRGLVVQFTEMNLARIKTPAQGSAPQIYEKV